MNALKNGSNVVRVLAATLGLALYNKHVFAYELPCNSPPSEANMGS